MTVSFTAVQQREFIFLVKCNVKGKPTPLAINIKAQGYGIKMSLCARDMNGLETLLDDHRVIDFGKVC